MVTQERQQEFTELLRRATQWASASPDIIAVGVVGSWARGAERMDSDVDLVFVVDQVAPYWYHDDWVLPLGSSGITRTQKWGPLHERRFVLDAGLEVEAGFVTRQWTRTGPVDVGTRRVVSAGMRIVYDPSGILADVQAECGQEP
ncbi:nucleotidyltransferase domain-containing protein [Qaidamihabitans albus]|uniref:nucleotidyltransferase domain-containing protein n=1 Tax=Qaidamihabitans albus TaxID=2795733 RepID=UPI0018F1C377|nr:nucleotidyltransferase domain-containing protein [Qaidamihabitans albus]